MDTLAWKTRIAILWAAPTTLVVAHLVLASETHNWLTRHGNLVLHSTFLYVIPSVMVMLTLLLPDRANRWTNVAVGLFYALLSGPIAFLECGLGVFMYNGPDPGTEQALLMGTRALLLLPIPVLAWRWPRRDSVAA